MRHSSRIGLAAFPLLALAALPVRAGEFKGRLLLGDKPANGAAVAAVPYETPFEKAKREAKRGADPAALAKNTAGADGAFTLTVPAEPGKEKPIQILIEKPGAVSVLFEDVWDASETEDLGEHVPQKAAARAGPSRP